MPNQVEVAGISIGIGANVGALDEELKRADTKVKEFAERWRKRDITFQIHAKPDATFQSVLDLKKKLEEPLKIDVTGKAHVEVTWSWADGHGPPPPEYDIGGGGGGGTPPQTGPTRGTRRTTRANLEETRPVETPETQPTPPRRAPRAPRTRARREEVAATQTEEATPEVRPQRARGRQQTVEEVAPAVAARRQDVATITPTEVMRATRLTKAVESNLGLGPGGLPKRFENLALGARQPGQGEGREEVGGPPYERPKEGAAKLGPAYNVFGGRGRSERFITGTEEPHPAGVWSDEERRARQQALEDMARLKREENAPEIEGRKLTSFGETHENQAGEEVRTFSKETVEKLKALVGGERAVNPEIKKALELAEKKGEHDFPRTDEALAELNDIRAQAEETIRKSYGPEKGAKASRRLENLRAGSLPRATGPVEAEATYIQANAAIRTVRQRQALFEERMRRQQAQSQAKDTLEARKEAGRITTIRPAEGTGAVLGGGTPGVPGSARPAIVPGTGYFTSKSGTGGGLGQEPGTPYRTGFTKVTPPVAEFARANPRVEEDAARYQRIVEQNRRAGRLGGLETQRRRRARLAGVPEVAPEVAAAAEPTISAADARNITAAATGATGGTGGGGRSGGGRGRGERPETPPEQQPLSRAAIQKIIGLDQARTIRDQVRGAQKDLFGYVQDTSQLGAEILRENPVRALSTSIGQFFVQTVGGRSDLERRIKDLNKANQGYSALLKQAGASRAAYREAQQALAKTDDEDVKQRLREQIPSLQRAAQGDRQAAQAQKKVVEERRSALQSARGISALRTLGVGAIGVAVGTEIFSHLLQGFSAVVNEFDKVLNKSADQLTGFGSTLTRTTQQITQQAFPTGAIQGAVATQLGQAGVGGAAAQALTPILQGLGTGGLASQRMSQFLDLLNSQRGAASALGGAPLSLAEVSNYQNIGGFRTPIGLTIGGQQPFTQQFGEAVRTLNPQGLVGAAQGLAQAGVPVGIPGVPFTPSREEIQAQHAAFTELISNFNTAIQRGGGTGQVAAEGARPGEQKALFAQIGTLGALGEGGKALASAVQDGSISIRDSNGNLITSLDGLKAVINAAGKGFAKPDQAQLLKAQEFAFKAAVSQRQIQGQEQRNTLLPIEAFQRLIAQPLVPFAQTAAARTPGARQAPNFKAASQDIADAQSKLQAFANEGRQAAQSFIKEWAGPQILGVWNDATAAVEKYGKQISQIQLSDTWMQVNLQTKQYDNELRIANRSLADAKEFLTGIKQAGSDNLGIIERQTRELDIQNTKLSFQAQALDLALRQRQINFQVAVAGFSAPGTTPEERAARVEEAKVEAEYAQKQLDIQKQQFEIAQKLFGKQQIEININASRAITDLTHQLGLLKEGRQVTIAVAIDQERLKALNDILNQEQARAQTALQEAVDIRNQVLSTQAQMAATLEEDLAKLIKETTGQFQTWLQGLYKAVQDSVPQPYGSVSTAGESDYGTRHPHAAGFLGNVSGATNMVVGEAGTETVAILRNPREMGMQSMSGTAANASPIYLSVNVTGNYVRDDRDIETLTDRMIKKIEEKLGRRGAQFGFAVVR